MHLDDRSKALIQEVFVNSGLKVKDLSRKYGLSRGQIDYSFKKINHWLEDNGFPPIKKDSRGFFVGDPKHQTLFLKEGKELTPDYIFSSEERALLICFILLTKTGDISLIHLTSELEVSKNTVLADLKKAQEIVRFYNLQIHYSRVEGYDMKGDEWNIRRLLLEVIDRIQRTSNGSQRLEVYGHLARDEINRMQDIIEHCESKMNIRFTDEKHNLLPYVFVCIIRRIQQGNMLNNGEIDFSQENVYNIILDLLEMEELISNADLSFLTLQILTANLTFSTEPDWSTDTAMMEGLRQMIQNFERISCTVFLDKEELLKKLWLHLKQIFPSTFNFDAQKLRDKIGIFGETHVMGFLIGCLIGAFGGYDIRSILTLGVQAGAALMLFPLVAKLFTTALTPVSESATSFMKKRFSNRAFTIGLDWPIMAGRSEHWLIMILTIPIILVYALILPGNLVLPFGGLMNICMVVPLFYLTMGNLPKMAIGTIIGIPMQLYVASYFAPHFTALANATGGVEVPDGQMLAWFGMDISELRYIIAEFSLFTPIGIVLFIITIALTIYYFKGIRKEDLKIKKELGIEE
ncbi:PTS transporter subunit IIC [Oceanobacillus sojae]|uniref:PTS transporter subunit IIC n=1 Tax=Oceanobacillus sojae TaxID=582851 RepID=UPI003642D60A